MTEVPLDTDDGFDEDALPAVIQGLSSLLIPDIAEVIWCYSQQEWFEFRQQGSLLFDRLPRRFARLSKLVAVIQAEVTFLELNCASDVFHTLTQYLLTHKGVPGSKPKKPLINKDLC